MLHPVERRSLSDSVFEQIRDRILDGALVPGARLPAERELSAQLGVNRSALREALKRLQQLQLVSIHPGGSTRVLDYRRSGGLELLTQLLFGGQLALRLDAARSLFELRTALGPDIAARAASRGGPAAGAALRAELDALDALPPEDAVGRQRRSMELWRVLVDASGNLAYQLAFNTMEQAWSSIQDLIAPALGDELRDVRGYQAMVRAVEAGDAARARRAAERLVGKGEAGLLGVLGAASVGVGADMGVASGRSGPKKEQR
jgi:GntR family transcriptional regulator, transcriptional repressor for pyruvate dehydrogenase complex